MQNILPFKFLCISCMSVAFLYPDVVSADTIVNHGIRKTGISVIDSVTGMPKNQILDEVVILGYSPIKSDDKVCETVKTRTYDEAAGTSLAAILEKVSGVSSIRTGTTVSKPVIQGMSGHRILLISNGVRLTGQQWGADHAPEVDINCYRDMLVIKGSEAILYGSDALGGIIVMNAAPLPFFGSTLSGRATLLYGTNGRKGMFSTTLEGALPFMKNIAWRLQGTYSNNGDRSTAHYILNNTGSREYDFSAQLGYRLINLNVEGSYSHYYNILGIMKCAQMGSEDMLDERIGLGRPVYVESFSRNITVPNQHVTHQTALLKVSYDFGSCGTLDWQGSWQQNDREEYNNRRQDSSIPTVSLHLTNIQNKLQWRMSMNHWHLNIGSSVYYIENHSKAGTGFVPVIPNYTETQMGVYALAKFHMESLGVEGGIRFDSQHTNAKGYDWTGVQYGGVRNFQNVTYSLGGHYDFNGSGKFTSNFGVAWRAPHVFELYSNGNDLASGMFVKGNSLMQSERSYKWITSVEYEYSFLTFKCDGFLQWIDGYIYDEPTKERVSVISGTYPLFRYRQTPAFFRGVDLDMSSQITGGLCHHLVTSYIAAEEKKTGNYLPYIPSLRFRQELYYMKCYKHLNLSTSVTHRYIARQRRFDPDRDLISYTPPAYHLFDLYAQLVLQYRDGKKLKLTASVENILNREYKEYTNRSRYYAHDMGRDIRLSATWTF